MSSTELSIVNSQSQSNAMAVFSRVDPMAFVKEMGKVFWVSGAGGAKNEQQGQVLALACICEGKHIFELAREYHLIDGKLSMRADAMLAKFRERGGKHKWLKDGKDGKAASIQLTFDGETLVSTYTIEEAETAKLIKKDGQWEKSRAAMLRARAVSEGIRMIAPEIVSGVYTPEENEDVAADEKPAAASTDKAAVKKRATELKEMNAGTAAATTTTATTQSGDVVDAEFTPATTAAATIEAATTTSSQSAESSESTVAAAAGTTSTASTNSTTSATSVGGGVDQATVTTDPAAPGSSTTATLMTIEGVLIRIGMSKEKLFEQLKAKNPTLTGLDALSENSARKLLENLESKAAAAKK